MVFISFLSIIGSTSIGASIVGGVCNNSGGSLIKRGPAYTELALYAKVNDAGELQLINDLGINLKFVSTFGFAISGFYPIIEGLMRNMKFTNLVYARRKIPKILIL